MGSLRQRMLGAIVSLALFSSAAYGQTWLSQVNKIRPLISLEAQVERILGKPINRYADIGEYETKDGVFSITYSMGRCGENQNSHYDVAKGVVTRFDFRPIRKIRFDSLKVDVSALPKEITDDVDPPIITYSDSRNGRSYSVQEGRLRYLEVEPGDDNPGLECSE